jgi:restriction endonuclease
MNFLALWEHIKHKTRYQVKLEEKELVEKCAKALRESDFRVSKPLIRIERASLDVTKGVFSASLLDQQNFEIKEDVGMEVLPRKQCMKFLWRQGVSATYLSIPSSS